MTSGGTMHMPDLQEVPAAEHMDIDANGVISGLSEEKPTSGQRPPRSIRCAGLLVSTVCCMALAVVYELTSVRGSPCSSPVLPDRTPRARPMCVIDALARSTGNGIFVVRTKPIPGAST
jgi:hypothetical protein